MTSLPPCLRQKERAHVFPHKSRPFFSHAILRTIGFNFII